MELKKKYGLATAISMVVGIIIGSGVFFKAGVVLQATDGNLLLGILAWIAGGIVMLFSSYTFSILSRRVKKNGGIVDYMEETCGKKMSYFVGFYMSTLYYPPLTAILAWLCGKYTCILFNIPGDLNSGIWTIVFAILYLIIIYLINAITPIIAGKFQVSSTIIKLVPLFFIAIVGTIFGLFFNNGMLIENFKYNLSFSASGFFRAVCATVFAYEGWIVVTSINHELNDLKRTLPKALVIGSLIVLSTYVFYYIGLAGTYPNDSFINDSEGTVKLAFMRLLGNAGGVILFVFVIISCIGTLNGLMMGCVRGIYAVAVRNLGPKPELFKRISEKTNMPTASTLFGMIPTFIWLFLWIGNFKGWYGNLFIDLSELCIIFLYVSYIPLYIIMMKKNKDLKAFERYIAPLLALIGAIFILFSCFYAHGIASYIFIALIIVDLLIAFILGHRHFVHSN